MNFAKTKERVLTKSFEHKYNDADGVEQTETITFSFVESFQTAAFMDALSRFEETRNCKEIAVQLSKALKSWEMDWNGEPFPPSVDNLANVCGFEFLMGLINSMLAVTTGNEPKPKPLQNGSAA